MLRIPTAVPDDQEVEKEPSNNNNNSIQPIRTFQNSSNITINNENNSTLNSPRPQSTLSYLSKKVPPSTSSRLPWPPQRMSQSSGHFNVDLPRSHAETGLHKLAQSQDYQSMHSSTIDHQSLMDALNSDSDQEQRRPYYERRKRSVVGEQQEQGGGEGSQYSTTTTDDGDSFDRDSIELAVSSGSSDNEDGHRNNSNRNNNDDDDDLMAENVGSETLMELLEAQKDLEQQMRAIEQQENDNEEYQENNNDDEQDKEQKEGMEEKKEFEMPTFIRVLYMGSASEKDKRIFLKKISQAFATLFYYDTPSWLRNPKMFKERKHHLLLMSLALPDIDEEEQDNLIETCEDNGLSIIEADFTWSTTIAMETDHYLTSMIEEYIWLQCESARQDLTSLKKKISIHNHYHRKNINSDKFDGFVYPDKAPNGIDLCVYFYNGSNNDNKMKNRIDEDLITLWRLKKLGIPIMPILSGEANITTPISLSSSSSSRTSKSRSQYHYQFHNCHQPSSRSLSTSTSPTTNTSNTSSLITSTTFNSTPTIDEQRTQFAYLLAQYKIRCVDLSLAKLDVGQPPSFQKRRRSSCYYSPTGTNTIVHGLEERLGKDWAASSMTSPAPYQILTIDQFAALDNQIVFSILKQSRQKAIKREKVLYAIQKGEEQEQQRQSTIMTMKNYNNYHRTMSYMTATDSPSSSWVITSVGNILMNPNGRMFQHLRIRFFASLFIILMIISAILICFDFSSPSSLERTGIIKSHGDKPWNLTAVIGMTTSHGDDGVLKQSLSFIVGLGDDKKNEKGEKNVQQHLSLSTSSSSKDDNTNRYECKVALPSYLSQAPISLLAKLDIQFPHPVNFTQFDFQCPLISLSEWQVSLENENKRSYSTVTTDETMKPSSSSSSSDIIYGDEQQQKSSRQKTQGGYWEHIYHTTNYLLHHQSKILNLVFNS